MRIPPLLVLLALYGGSSGFLFGYDLGMIVATLPLLDIHEGLSDAQIEAIVGHTKIGAALSALSSVWLARQGPRCGLCLSNVAFVCGPLLMAVGSGGGSEDGSGESGSGAGWWHLAVGRLLTGCGIGLSAVTAPMYLGDIAPTAVRGAIVTAYELMLTVGVLAASLVCYVMQLPGPAACVSRLLPSFAVWRVMVLLPVLPALALLAASLALPEPPARLVARGQIDRAFALLLRLHSSRPPAGAASGRQQLHSSTGVRGSSAGFRRVASTCSSRTVTGDASGQYGAASGQHGAASGQHGDASGQHGDASGQHGAERLMRFTSASSVGSFSALPLSAAAEELRSHEVAMVQAQEALDTLVAAHAIGTARLRPASVRSLLFGRERRATRLMLLLAICNQANGVSTLSIYLGTVLARQLGFEERSAGLISSALVAIKLGGAAASNRRQLGLSGAAAAKEATGRWPLGCVQRPRRQPDGGLSAVCISAMQVLSNRDAFPNMAGAVLLAMLVVDSVGRRRLLLVGSLLTAAALALSAAAISLGSPPLTIASIGLTVVFYAASIAPVFYVLLAELFSDAARPVAVAAATAATFATGALTDSVFLSLCGAVGYSGTLAVFSVLCVVGGGATLIVLPETKGRSRLAVLRLIAADRPNAADGGGGGGDATLHTELSAAEEEEDAEVREPPRDGWLARRGSSALVLAS